MKGNYNNLDIAPLEALAMNVSATDTPRNITFTDEPFHIQSVSWEYDHRTMLKKPSIELCQLVNGTAGVTIPVPPIPDDKGYNSPRVNATPITPSIIAGLSAGPAPYAWFTYWLSDVTPYTDQFSRGISIPYSDTSSNLLMIVHFTIPSTGLYMIGGNSSVRKNESLGEYASMAINDVNAGGWDYWIHTTGIQTTTLYNVFGSVPSSATQALSTMAYLQAGRRIYVQVYSHSSLAQVESFGAWIYRISS
jgi:hypothetical protein